MAYDTFVENAWYVAGRSSEFPVDQRDIYGGIASVALAALTSRG